MRLLTKDMGLYWAVYSQCWVDMPPASTTAVYKRIARGIIKDMGYGHREAVYQRAMVNALAQANISSQTEVPVPFFYKGICVGNGRIDVLTKTHIVELKAVHISPAKMDTCELQLKKYANTLKAAGAGKKELLLIIFDNSARKTIFKSFV